MRERNKIPEKISPQFVLQVEKTDGCGPNLFLNKFCIIQQKKKKKKQHFQILHLSYKLASTVTKFNPEIKCPTSAINRVSIQQEGMVEYKCTT